MCVRTCAHVLQPVERQPPANLLTVVQLGKLSSTLVRLAPHGFLKLHEFAELLLRAAGEGTLPDGCVRACVRTCAHACECTCNCACAAVCMHACVRGWGGVNMRAAVLHAACTCGVCLCMHAAARH